MPCTWTLFPHRRRSPRPPREAADALLLLQISSLEAEAREMGARYGLPSPDFCSPRPEDLDDGADGGGDVGEGGEGDAGGDKVMSEA